MQNHILYSDLDTSACGPFKVIERNQLVDKAPAKDGVVDQIEPVNEAKLINPIEVHTTSN